MKNEPCPKCGSMDTWKVRERSQIFVKHVICGIKEDIDVENEEHEFFECALCRHQWRDER